MVGDGRGGSDEEQSVASTRPHFRLKQGTGHLKKVVEGSSIKYVMQFLAAPSSPPPVTLVKKGSVLMLQHLGPLSPS